MTQAVWRNALHKFIVATGIMALTAIVAGATSTSAPGTWSPTLFERHVPRPSPIVADACDSEDWRDNMLLRPGQTRTPSCTSVRKPVSK